MNEVKDTPTVSAAAAPVPPRVRRLVVVLAAVMAAAGAAGTALSPYLLVEHPLLLVALSPEGRHVILAAGQVDLSPMLAVAVPRRILSMLSTYGLGFVFGYAAMRWAEQRYPRMGVVLRMLERLFGRFGAPILALLPIYTMSALAGVARTRPWTFLAATAIGQTGWVTLNYYFGEAIIGWTKPIVAFLSEHVLACTVATVLVVVAQQLIAYRKRARDNAAAEASIQG